MNRRDFLRQTMVAFGAAGLAVSAVRASAAPGHPNILLVLSDDHSVPHLGCYGSPNAVTPHLDAFAAEGMRFNRAYTTSPQCAPSRASIFAGRSPVALGVTRFTQPAPPETVFFTDVLRDAGYWVGLDGRYHHLAGRVREEPEIVAALEEAGLDYVQERFDHVNITGTKGEAGIAQAAKQLGDTLDSVPDGKPFFLYFGFNQPHRGWGKNEDTETFDPDKFVLPPDWPDLPEVREEYGQFLYEVHELDRGFGMLMDVLDQRGLRENTIVLFMGDNGESLLRGKGTLYDRGTHVPLLVRWPGVVRPDSECDALISGEDLAATLLGAVGLAVPEKMTSVSFLPALRGEAFTGREYVFAERGWHFGPVTRTDGLDLSRSVTSRRYRLIYNLLPERAYTPVDMPGTAAWKALTAASKAGTLSPLHQRLLFNTPRPVFELFDLESDPHELKNLAGNPEYTEVEKTLRNALGAWMVREGDFLPLASQKLPSE